MSNPTIAVSLALAATVAGAPQAAAEVFTPALVSTTEVKPNLWISVNMDSNNVVAFGPDGTVLVDTSYLDDHRDYVSAIRDFIVAESGSPDVETLIVSHWHVDHTEGLAGLRGASTNVWSHANAARTLSDPNDMLGLRELLEPLGEPWQFQPLPAALQPNRTFRGTKALRKNGYTFVLDHAPRAHTDGDTVVYVPEAKLVYTGDVYFNKFFPLVDRDNGGTLAGIIREQDKIANSIPRDAIVVPGHGAVTDRAELRAYTAMLRDARRRVEAASCHGATEDEVVAAKPLAALVPTWQAGLVAALAAYGTPEETIDFAVGLWTDQFVRTTYRELRGR